MKKKLIIVGDSAFGEIAHEYFLHDSPYEPVAFAVESAFRTKDTLAGLPVVDVESLESQFTPGEHSFYVAIVYRKMNRIRTRLVGDMKEKGFSAASYISSQAFVWHNVELGEHCFIFENNVVQPFVKVGNNVVLWSGNHIGHHSTIGDNCFVSSHVCVAGFCNVEANCFLGVNASIGNDVTVGQDSWLSPGVGVTKNIKPGTLIKMSKPSVASVSTYHMFDVEEPV